MTTTSANLTIKPVTWTIVTSDGKQVLVVQIGDHPPTTVDPLKFIDWLATISTETQPLREPAR